MSWNEIDNVVRMEYVVVVFFYSDRIGRGGDWLLLSWFEIKVIWVVVIKSMFNGCKFVFKVLGVDRLRM